MTAANTPGVAAATAPYVAVVVFHGMGQQRHYEAVAQLVEALDAHVYRQSRADPDAYKSPRLDRVWRREKLRGADDAVRGNEAEIVYVQADYAAAAPTARVRFYEGYWAPATVEGTTTRSVFVWLMGQLVRPLTVLGAPWRAFGRIRRADLLAMAFAKPVERDPPPGYATLVRLYAHFAQRRPPERGSFSSFLGYVRRSIAKEAGRKQALALAGAWFARHVGRQLGDALVLLMLGLSIVASGVLLLFGAFALLHAAFDYAGSTAAGAWIGRLPDEYKPGFKSAWAFAGFLLGALGITRFLRNAVGDVQQFVTYEEAEPLHARREKVLALAERTLRHVLADPACQRVVIVAHSLGTAVALDTILRLRAANQARNPTADAQVHMTCPLPLGKLQHLVTCGSPIDKITYFFATLRSEFRTYELMIDDLRGDIGNIPFSRPGRQPYIHWVNFWDRGDPISGPLYTLASADVLRVQRVDNVRVASYAWPDPAASHAAYFRHRDVVSFVYRAAFCNFASFATPPRETVPGADGERPVYSWQGPGCGSILQSVLLLGLPAAAILTIWTAAGLLLPALPAPSLIDLGAFVGVLAGGAIVQRALRLHRARI